MGEKKFQNSLEKISQLLSKTKSISPIESAQNLIKEKLANSEKKTLTNEIVLPKLLKSNKNHRSQSLVRTRKTFLGNN